MHITYTGFRIQPTAIPRAIPTVKGTLSEEAKLVVAMTQSIVHRRKFMTLNISGWMMDVCR